MLFKILKLFGLDVPAKIAATRTEFEHRVEEAADYAKRVTMAAAIVAAFSAVAAFLFFVAAGLGLFALYRVVAEHYGVYAGLGTVAGLLIGAASVLLLAANTRAQTLSNLRIVRQSSSPALSPASENLAAQASPALPPPAVAAFTANEFGSRSIRAPGVCVREVRQIPDIRQSGSRPVHRRPEGIGARNRGRRRAPRGQSRPAW